jgi:plastocyanin
VDDKLALLFDGLALAIVVAGILLAVGTARISGPVLVSGESVPANILTNTNTINNTTENVVKVKTGGGDNNKSSTQFFPQIVEIKTGQSVTWYNPTKVPEPHTVTFQMGSLYPIQSFLPVELSKSAQFRTLLPSTDSNGQPIVVPGQNHTIFIIAANARAYNPVVINSIGNVTFLDWNAKYTMNGSEKYINSGWLFPTGEVPPGIQAGRTFTITFEKAGLYEYSCVFHPWMTGKVVVK